MAIKNTWTAHNPPSFQLIMSHHWSNELFFLLQSSLRISYFDDKNSFWWQIYDRWFCLCLGHGWMLNLNNSRGLLTEGKTRRSDGWTWGGNAAAQKSLHASAWWMEERSSGERRAEMGTGRGWAWQEGSWAVAAGTGGAATCYLCAWEHPVGSPSWKERIQASWRNHLCQAHSLLAFCSSLCFVSP